MALIVTTTLSSSSTTRTLGCSRIARRSLDRQRDHEGRAATEAAAHAHRAAMTLHDALRDPQPEAGALARLRREEWLEDLRQKVVRDALPGVAHLDLDGVATEELCLGAGTGLGGHRDRPALRHGIRGVQQEIEEDLLQLIRRRANARQSRVELVRDLNSALAEPLGHKSAGLLHERVEIRVTQRLLLTIEAKHLTEDARHPLRLASRNVQVWPLGGVLAELFLKEVQRVLDGLERIVDLVRDRCREPSRRRELLGVEEDLLEPPSFELPQASDVLHDRVDRYDRATRVADLGRADLHLETIVVPRIGERDLSALRHRRIQPKTGEE